MALTFTSIKKNVVGAARVHTYDITFDNSYPTGGEAVLPSDLGLSSLNYLAISSKTAGSRLFAYDYTNQKILIYTALGTEATNASDQSTIVVRVHAWGDQVTGS